MFFVRLGFCKERKSSRISALTIASKLGKHTSSFDSCLCARNDLFKRVHHRTKTHKVSDVGGTKIFAPSIFDSSKDANAKTASCERRGSYLAVAHSHHLRRRLYFFSCIQTLATTTRAKRRSASCEEFFLCLVLFLLSFHWIHSLFAEERTNGANETNSV
jgi:hypothetical protein